MDTIVNAEELQNGQMLTEEMWADIDKEIALHSDEELKKGFIVRDFGGKMFLAIKRMTMGVDAIKVEPAFAAEDAESKLSDLNILDIAPGGVSRATGKICPDKVWLIDKEGKITNPATNRPCQFNKSKLGKVIVAHDGVFGPFYVGIPNTDVNGDGNFDCAGFRYVDEAIDFVENKRWLDKEFMNESSKQTDEGEAK